MDGNWTWVRKGCRIVDENGQKVAEVSVSHCDEAELNRRGQAIAAVPDMIAALQEVEDHIVTMYAGICGGDAEAARRFADKDPTVAKARAALSRALTPEGE